MAYTGRLLPFGWSFAGTKARFISAPRPSLEWETIMFPSADAPFVTTITVQASAPAPSSETIAAPAINFFSKRTASSYLV